MLCDLYRNAQQAQFILILARDCKRKRSKWLALDGAGMAGASIPKTPQLADILIAHIWLHILTCNEKQKSNSSSSDRESECRTWSDCVNNNSPLTITNRNIIACLWCITPLLQRWMDIWEACWAKSTCTAIQSGQMWHGQMSHVCCTPRKKYRPERLTHTVRGSGGFVML